jgi:hypothetical protein
MNAWSSARRGVAAIPRIADSEIPPFGQPLHGIVGGSLGLGVAAFLVTAALSGRAGVADLGRRSVRWRVPVRWYLIALGSDPLAFGVTRIVLLTVGLIYATPSIANKTPMARGRNLDWSTRYARQRMSRPKNTV